MSNARNLWMSVGRRTLPTSSKPGIGQSPRANAGGEGTPVLSVVNMDEGIPEKCSERPASIGSLMDDIVREGARRMLAAALEAEVNQYIAELAGERDEVGRRLVVRNGHHRERTVTTAAGPVTVKAPRVNDKRVDVATGERKRFSSKILAPWCRKSPKISEVLPLLYLHGLSSGTSCPRSSSSWAPAGLSPATVTRLTKQWSETTPPSRPVTCRSGLRLRVGRRRPPQGPSRPGPLCVLVLMGVRADGRKELIALAEGLRESTESWADLLRDCRRRGMRDPENSSSVTARWACGGRSRRCSRRPGTRGAGFTRSAMS